MHDSIPLSTVRAFNASNLKRSQIKALVAPTLAALSRVNLNSRPYRLARWLVECTLARGVNFMFAPRLEFIAGPLKFSKTEIHEILHGYKSAGQPVVGLVEIGFVRVRECALDKGWLLVIQPEASRWGAPAVYSAAEHARKLADVDAVRLTFARQLESRGIAEWFPDLKAVLDEVSLENALLAAGGVPNASDDMAGNAREVNAGDVRGATSLRFSGVTRNARNVLDLNSAVAVRPAGSEIQNARERENIGKTERVLKFRTPLSLKTQDSSKKLKNNLKDWRGYSTEQKKDALAELETCTNDDRIRQLLEVIMGDDVCEHDAGKWIKARWFKPAAVQVVMTLLIEDMAAGRTRCAGSSAHAYGRQQKIFKESFKTH